MKFPYEKYIKFLILSKFDNRSINGILRSEQFIIPSTADLSRMRSELGATPSSFNPYDSEHKESNLFLCRLGIDKFFHPGNFMKEAFRVLRSPVTRNVVEIMLLSGKHPDDIISSLLSVAEPTPSVNGILCFRSCFWDLQSLTFGEMMEFLKVHPLRDVFMHVISHAAPLNNGVAGVLLNMHTPKSASLPLCWSIKDKNFLEHLTKETDDGEDIYGHQTSYQYSKAKKAIIDWEPLTRHKA
jgi:hypothetical protein